MGEGKRTTAHQNLDVVTIVQHTVAGAAEIRLVVDLSLSVRAGTRERRSVWVGGRRRQLSCGMRWRRRLVERNLRRGRCL